MIDAGNGIRHVPALRPHGHVLKQASLAFLALIIPLSAALYALSIPHGPWLAVLIGQCVVTVVFVAGIIAARRAGIWVDRTTVTERGFFGRSHTFARSDITGVIMLELYLSDALETRPHLFVTGAEGGLLLRMRGQFWSRTAMETFIDLLGAPIDRVAEPITLRELRLARPELLYWFERR